MTYRIKLEDELLKEVRLAPLQDLFLVRSIVEGSTNPILRNLYLVLGDELKSRDASYMPHVPTSDELTPGRE